MTAPWALAVALAVAAGGGAEAEWDSLLRAHVRGEGVDYRGFAKDRPRLDRVVERLGKAKAQSSLAFYLNAYNAFVVSAVLDHEVKDSVREVPDFFKEPRFVLHGRRVSLDELEAELRERFGEPRIHFALNCASRGCPRLHGRAFRPSDLDRVLDALTREFIRKDVGLEGKRIRLSELFKWYAKDFERDGRSLHAYLLPYVRGDALRRALEEQWPLEFSPYDWALNAAPPGR